MKKVGLSILGVMAVLVGTVWLVDQAQTFESYYETYDKLKETEQMSRAFVSRVIPESSYEIYTIHRFSGELVSVRFKYKPEDVKAVQSGCTAFAYDDPRIREYRCQPSSHSVVVRLEPNGEGLIVRNN